MQALVNGLLDFFIGIFTIITSPIQNFINDNFPALNEVANFLMPAFDIINRQWIPWLKDLTLVPFGIWQFIVGYLIFHFTLAIFTNVITLIAKWWATVVP